MNPSMPYDQFYENFLLTNSICIFDAEITKEWSSRRNWNLNNAPNFKLLKDCFGKKGCTKRDISLKLFYNYLIFFR